MLEMQRLDAARKAAQEADDAAAKEAELGKEKKAAELAVSNVDLQFSSWSHACAAVSIVSQRSHFAFCVPLLRRSALSAMLALMMSVKSRISIPLTFPARSWLRLCAMDMPCASCALP